MNTYTSSLKRSSLEFVTMVRFQGLLSYYRWCCRKKEKESGKEDGIDLLLFFSCWIICLLGVIHQNKNWRKMEGLNGRGAGPHDNNKCKLYLSEDMRNLWRLLFAFSSSKTSPMYSHTNVPRRIASPALRAQPWESTMRVINTDSWKQYNNDKWYG